MGTSFKKRKSSKKFQSTNDIEMTSNNDSKSSSTNTFFQLNIKNKNKNNILAIKNHNRDDSNIHLQHINPMLSSDIKNKI